MKKVNIFTMSVCLLMGVLLSTGSLFAQTSITVKGTVKDASGAPIVGAAVMLDGTTDGTITDIDGKYSLTFRPKGEKLPDLVFSSISYVTQNVRIAGRRVIDVILEEDAEQLEEVVVVGYGAMRKSDITGSVTSVKIDEDQAGQSASIDQLLQGKAAGVQVVSNSGAPDAGVNITIRGAGSFSSSTQPLYVVDGVIMNTSGTVDMGSRGGTDSGEVEETNGLIGLSPQDIASMEILKDASATAIYGSQGANGVVLITTKSASQARPSVTFTSGVSIGQLSKKYDLMDAGDYVQFLKLKGIPENSTHFIVYTDLLNEGTYQEVDWQDYSTRTSVTQRYYLTISGRPKNTNYRFSIGYNDNQGIIKQTGYTNLFTRLNLDKTIGRFTIGTKTAISYLQSSMMQGVGGIGQTPNTSLVFSMLMTRPVIRQIETDDEGLEVDDESIPLAGPDRWFRDYESERSEFRVISSIYGDVKILDWLSFKTTFGIDCRSEERSTFKSNKINSTGTGSHGSVTNINRLNWNWDNLLNADKKLGRHRIMGTLGHSMFCSSSNYMTVQGNNVKQWKAKSASLNSAPYAWQTYTESQNQLLSFFARATYNYDERYVVTGTFRFDGSSKFAGKNKWAPFPSFAAAWRISNEPWFKRFRFHAPWFTSAKLRLGWGMVGNQNIAAYQTIYRYSSSFAATHDNDYHKLVAMSSLNLPTPDLKWETTTQYNVGLDLDFFKGRLVVAADGYYKKTDDLLQQRVLGASAGINNPYVIPDETEKVVGCKEFVEEGYDAQLKSVVMIKNHDSVLPIAKGSKVFMPERLYPASIPFFGRFYKMSQDRWKYPIALDLLEKYYTVTNDPREADFALVQIMSPEGNFGYLERDAATGGNGYVPISLQYSRYTAEHARKQSIAGGDPKENFTNRSYRGKTERSYNASDLKLVNDTKRIMGDKPVVVLVRADRPFVPEFEPSSDAVLIGLGVSNQAYLDIVCGQAEPYGLLPLQLPKDMKTVEEQFEDVPRDMECYKDSDGNVYDFAFGLNWSGVISDWRVEKYK